MTDQTVVTSASLGLSDDAISASVVPIDSLVHPHVVRRLAGLSSGRATSAASSPEADATMEFAVSVARGLSDHPRRLESRFLYDAQGSDLFERICEQPEYYLTRTEASILSAAASDIAEKTGDVALVELGSGSSIKTRLLLDAYVERFGSARYTPVDVSSSALSVAETEIAAHCPQVDFDSVHGTYDDVFPRLEALSPCMLLFLGSTVGNLDHVETAAFWSRVATHLKPGDFCLLGVDTGEDPDVLHAAYNDAAGHSAAFTCNVFARMNRELGSSLDMDAIDHVARYVPHLRRVEIFGRFLKDQEIEIQPLGHTLRVSRGEMILTEVSRKFRLRQLVPYLCTFGLVARHVYADRDRRVAVLLLERT